MRLQPLLVALLLAGITAPACAETIPGADETHGQTLGLGFAGLSYDVGLYGTSLGAALNMADYGTPTQRVQLGLRAMHDFYAQDGVAAGWIGGVQYDPGTAAQHALLTPDLGLAIAWRFVPPSGVQALGAQAVVLRANVTLAPWRNPGNEDLLPNFFQSFGLGPDSTLALVLEYSRTFSITVGGGTLLGLQLRF